MGLRKWLRRVAGLSLAFAAGFLFLSSGLPLRAQAAGAIVPPEVEAGSYLVMDAATGQVLLQKNADQAKFPASVTKILTLGLTLEAIEGQENLLDERIEASQRACDELIPDATSIGLTAGENLTLRDLLYATQVESANDAANVLAEYIGGSLEGFAEVMNAKAAELGLGGSHFVNPSGQPNEAHVTTAYDMAAITRWALGVPGFRELFAATGYQMTPSNRRAGGNFQGGNSIIQPGHRFYYEGVTGSKMGYTDAARYTLATTAQRDGMELVCIVLDCPTNEAKYESTRALLDYSFGNFSPAVFPASAFETDAVPVMGGGEGSLGEIILLGEDVPFLLHNGLSLDNVLVTYHVPEAYVIGKDFEPTATITLAQADSEVLLATIPLTWTGLDEILAANTSIIVQIARQYPLAFWLVTAALLVAILTVIIFSIHRRHQSNKRRAARLAAARARMPVRLEDRPTPLSRRSPGPAVAVAGGAPSPEGPRRPGRSELRVYKNPRTGEIQYFSEAEGAAADPRRVGRAR